MAAWKPAEEASVELAFRNRTTMLLRPVPKSAASLSATCADSEFGSSQPPDERPLDALVAKKPTPIATASVMITMGRRKR